MTSRAASIAAILCATLTGAQVLNFKQPTTWVGRFSTKEISGWSSSTRQFSPVIQPARTLSECLDACGRQSACKSAVWSARQKTCNVSSTAITCDDYAAGTGSEYYCGQKLEWNPYGISVFQGCKDARRAGVNESGIIYVDPDGSGIIPVLCEFTDSESWLIIQRRMDGSQDFFRDWNSYRNGFGDFATEFWLGLENIRRLSASGAELSIYMDAFDESWAYANYSHFYIGAESARYPLNISGYSGNAGDSLAYHNGAAFCTYDRDTSAAGCANTFKGAWWYIGCHYSNLNGLYLRGATSQYATADCWFHFKGYYYALRSTAMRLKV